MRLYSRTGASSVQNEDYGSFDVDPDTGAVEVPQKLGVLLHGLHVGGRPAWETEGERTARLMAEEAERRKDPATLLAAVEALAARIAPEPEPEAGPEPEPVATHPDGEPLVAVEHPADGTMSPEVSNDPVPVPEVGSAAAVVKPKPKAAPRPRKPRAPRAAK